MLRQLASEEIIRQATALQELEVWERAQSFAQRLFGPRAHTVEVQCVFMEPDPDSIRFSLVTKIEEWFVLDEHSVTLEPDLGLEFWQAYASALQRARRRGNERSVIQDIVYREIHDALPPEVAEYRRDKRPAPPFQAVYVQEG